MHADDSLHLSCACLLLHKSCRHPGGSPACCSTGKYLGVLDRIAHIRAVGATAVMLSSPFLSGAGDGPFGRAPFSFFAPERAWASGSDALAPARELKELVRGLHAKGIEVWLQVSFPATLWVAALPSMCSDCGHGMLVASYRALDQPVNSVGDLS